jgi:hypothetical protein
MLHFLSIARFDIGARAKAQIEGESRLGVRARRVALPRRLIMSDTHFNS